VVALGNRLMFVYSSFRPKSFVKRDSMNETAPLQFDRAEYSSPATSTICAQCDQALVQSYYEVNGALLCPVCRERLNEAASGSAVVRLFRALIAGLGAAILGAIVWWGVRKGTGYEVGLISIGIGIGVGRAVRWGSKGRGGWAYQLIAVLLTYAAVAGNYTPDVIEAIQENAKQEEAAASKAPPQSSTSKPPAKVSGDANEAPSFGEFLLALVALFAIAAAAPFMQGASNIIGLLIIAFGLFEAWKINRRAPLTINGPFAVAAPAPANV
jgi:hypothetical protein